MRRTMGLVIALIVGGCGGAAESVVGSYECGPEGQTALEVWELREGGGLTVSVIESGERSEGTWTTQDEQVIISFSGADDDPFTVEENRLVYAGQAGPEGTWICIRTS